MRKKVPCITSWKRAQATWSQPWLSLVSSTPSSPFSASSATTASKYVEFNVLCFNRPTFECLLAGFMLVVVCSLCTVQVPLVIFKREKELARKLEFDGLYVTEQPEDDDIKGQWDRLVLNTP